MSKPNRGKALYGSEKFRFVPANSVANDRLLEFAAAAWPERSRERVLSSWWRRADPGCAVAAIDQRTGAMAAICGARPSRWVIGRNEVSATAICEWFVIAGQGGSGLGPGLGRRMLRRFSGKGRFLYAYSMNSAAAVNLARAGWLGPQRASLLALPFPRLARIPAKLFCGRSSVELCDHVVTHGRLPKPLSSDLNRIASSWTRPAHMQRDSAEWTWRLSICPDRLYRFCVARRGCAPVGYVAVRRLTPGRSRVLVATAAALVVDLIVVGDDDEALHALIRRAVMMAAELKTSVLLAVTTGEGQRRAFSSRGFLSARSPVLGRRIRNAEPQFMWSPEGPGAAIDPAGIAFSFADSDVDLNL